MAFPANIPPPGDGDAAHSPIANDELPGLFGCLAEYGTIFLAISGGADSTALMHLVAAWRAEGGHACDVRVLTVDHGLRPEARAEAEAVAAQATSLGMPADILTWSGTVPQTGLQEAARDLRYGLMFAQIAAHAADRQASICRIEATAPAAAALVTAHHRDDLAETVLMRLARGSGVDGLAALRMLTRRHGVALVRPLLATPKARLMATLRVRGQTWLEDPSNQNAAFERVRLRSGIAARRELGLTNAALALTARRMARASDALEEITDAAQCARLSDPLLNRAGVFQWQWAPQELPEEIAIRLLQRLLPVIGGGDQRPQLARIERLLDDMQSSSFSGATLANCVIAPDSGPNGAADELAYRIIYREPRRVVLSSLTTVLATPVIWDNRFELASTGALTVPINIRPFRRNDLKMFDFDASATPLPCPVEALEATPVVVDARESLSAPFWIPALDVHRNGVTARCLPQLSCRFLVNRLMRG